MLLLQRLHRTPHRTLKSLSPRHQRVSSRGPLPLHEHQSIPRQPSRNFHQMPRSSLQILRVRRIPNPDPLFNGPVTPNLTLVTPNPTLVIPNEVRNLLSASITTARRARLTAASLGTRYWVLGTQLRPPI